MVKRKLVLSRETLATLDSDELADINGGTGWLARSLAKGTRYVSAASRAVRAASEAACSAIARKAVQIAESVATGVAGNYIYERFKNRGNQGGNGQ